MWAFCAIITKPEVCGRVEALIFTRDNNEYNNIKQLLETESSLIEVYRDPLNGHCHFNHEYDIVVVALNGAQGMELVLEYSRRFDDTHIIWITDDPYFAGTAIRQHIYDFIERPYDTERLKNAVHEAIQLCPNRNVWKHDASRRKAQ